MALVEHGARRSDVVERAYSAAARYQGGGALELWRPRRSSVDAEILSDGPDLRAKARDLVRNHPFARQALRTSQLGVVGKRMRYSCRIDWKFLGIDEDHARHWASEWERVWERYAHSYHNWSDAAGQRSFTQLMALIHASDFVDGEFALAATWKKNRRWHSCWNAVDVDRLSQPDGRPETRFFRGGVEVDRDGMPIAYHIRGGHPGDYRHMDLETERWDRYPRTTEWGRPVLLHGFDHQRPGQTRGVTEMASVIEAMKMGKEYSDTALQAAILQTSYAAVIQSKANYRDAMEAIGQSADADGLGRDTVLELAMENLEAAQAWHDVVKLRFNGAKVAKLYPDEELKLLTPNNSAASLGEFQTHSARSYAAGVGVDPIGVSQDYSNVNYSSAKMAQATVHRGYAAKRERLAHQAGLPMVAAALEEAVFAGAMWLPQGLSPADFYVAQDALIQGVFLSQGAPNLDPMKEAQALEKALQNGTTTLQEACAAEGKDWMDVLEQRSREKAEMKARGLGDPMWMFEDAAPEEGAVDDAA